MFGLIISQIVAAGLLFLKGLCGSDFILSSTIDDAPLAPEFDGLRHKLPHQTLSIAIPQDGIGWQEKPGNSSLDTKPTTPQKINDVGQ